MVLGTTKKQARSGDGNYQEVDEDLNLRLIEWAQEYCPQTHFISAMGLNGKVECLSKSS